MKDIASLGLLGPVLPLLAGESVQPGSDSSKGQGCRFLFQGDSITDGNRSRNEDWNHVMGHGYAYLLCSRLAYTFPEKQFEFFNRGISGNKIPDLQARWQKDCLDMKPDVLSILVGINDTAAFLGGNANFDSHSFEESFKKLITETKAQLPAVQLVLCEPFILEVGRVKDNYANYLIEIKKRQLVVKELAAVTNAIFVPLQSAFDRALKKAPPAYWIWDGIHPMPAGHELIAREWLSHVKNKLAFLR